jgi:hypothetical protein
MAEDRRRQLSEIKQFKQLIAFLRDEMGWPIDAESDFDDLTYEYTTAELGIDEKSAAQIQDIKRLRPLSPNQPWGVFFVKFEPKKLPVIALRRILSQVALKKRASANPADRSVWAQEDLLFISNYGEGDDRQITLAHFSAPSEGHTLPTLKVLGWDSKDTALHLEAVARELTEQLSWPSDESDVTAWRAQWSAAFTVGHQEVITTSKALSIRLAQLARDIRDRIYSALVIETKDGPLTKLMMALQKSLVHDLTPGDFADMYAQTIAYGLLSSRVADPKNKSVDDFSVHMRLSPFLKELMETFLQTGGRNNRSGLDFDELGVGEVVDLLDRANMEAVVADFGDKNPEEDPVIHFYELFLKEYDAKIRMSRGVFYTPRPVVSYIIRSVDALLRTEFGLSDGLADTATWGEMVERNKNLKIPDGISPDQAYIRILDPATGTGTFLVEAIDLIHKSLIGKWSALGHGEQKRIELWNEYVPKHLLPRLYGYELLMAPFAMAHLKIGLKLLETKYRFESDERARVYLTNTLEPPQDATAQFQYAIAALAHESAAVNDIKQHQRFTVIIGNPPYSGVSSNMTESAQRIVDAYRLVDGQPLKERKIWLQDDYVKFFRHGQLAIDNSGSGVLGFITNSGYLSNPTFRGMRQSLAATFGKILVLDLHGNPLYKASSDQGVDDKNVFDIIQGVAVCIAAKSTGTAVVHHSDLIGSRESKYVRLLGPLNADIKFVQIYPDTPYYFFTPQDMSAREEYESGWPISSIMPTHSAGALTARDHFVIDTDRESLIERIEDFKQLGTSDEVIREKYFAGFGSAKYPSGDSRGWKLPAARDAVQRDSLWRDRVRLYNYRPFDFRYIYWTKSMVDWPRPELERLMSSTDQIALCITRFNRQRSTGYFFVTRVMADFHLLDTIGDSMSLFPLKLPTDNELNFGVRMRGINLDSSFVESLETMLGTSIDSSGPGIDITSEHVISYIYAVLHSPNYRSRYADFLKIDFPRLPLTENLELFRALARLGGELTALHLLEAPTLNQPITEFVGSRNIEVEKTSWSHETVWVDKAQTVGFSGVSESVWNFHIGGYQVCEKWLKDRKGRTLSDEDIEHYQKIVVALSETIRLMKEIDEVIEHHGGWPGAFSGAKAAH